MISAGGMGVFTLLVHLLLAVGLWLLAFFEHQLYKDIYNEKDVTNTIDQFRGYSYGFASSFVILVCSELLITVL